MGAQDGVARLKRAVVIAVALLAAIVRVLPIGDPDYHWHLATGRFVVTQRAIPTVDPFSHTAAGLRWKFVDWVADVTMYLVHRVGGDSANILLFAGLGGLGVALAAERARRRVETPALLFAVALTVAACVAFRVTARPQTALFPFCGWLFLAIDRARASPRALLLLPFIVIIWQNIHSSAILASAVIAAYALEAIVTKRAARVWLATALASIAGVFVCAHPIERFVAGFAHLGDRRVAALFPEWGSPFSESVAGGWVLAAIVLLLLSGIAAAARRGSIGEWSAVALLGVVGFTSARFLPLFAIAVAPLAVEGLAVMRRELARSAVTIGAVLLAVLCFAPRLARPRLGLVDDAYPVRAAAFVRDHRLEGKLFNDYHFGGYLIWALDARTPVFVDGRSMALYGVEFVRDVATATDDRLNGLIDRYGATIAIVPPDRRMGALQRRPGWALVMFDDAAAVLVREDAVAGASALAYRALTPGRWFDLEWLRADPERLALAEREIVRAHADAPDSAQVAVLEVMIPLAAGDRARADAALASAEARFPGSNRVLRARMIRCIDGGDRACACATARKVAHDFPNNSYASATIITMNCP